MTPRSMQCTGISIFDSRISRGKISSLCVFHTVRVDETSSIQPRGKRSQVGGGVSRQFEAPDGPWWNFSRISQIAANLLLEYSKKRSFFLSCSSCLSRGTKARLVFLPIDHHRICTLPLCSIILKEANYRETDFRRIRGLSPFFLSSVLVSKWWF